MAKDRLSISKNCMFSFISVANILYTDKNVMSSGNYDNQVIRVIHKYYIIVL